MDDDRTQHRPVLAVAMYGTIFIIVAFQGARPAAGMAGISESVVTTGFHGVFFFGAVLGAAVLVLSLLIREVPRTDHDGCDAVIEMGMM